MWCVVSVWKESSTMAKAFPREWYQCMACVLRSDLYDFCVMSVFVKMTVSRMQEGHPGGNACHVVSLYSFVYYRAPDTRYILI